MGEQDIRQRLEAIGEELADLAYDALRRAADGDGDTGEERRLTRARRAVERAVAALGGAEE
ncbi:MAG TPA: hypothetical protein VFP54_09460 [Acidimicrobiales bacterium]|nr:hypothetical protein [Acidimicrobiales bacterium]